MVKGKGEKMERLTKRNEYGVYYPYCDSAKGCGGHCASCEFERKITKKLADYEDAEEQGLLLRLPCKVGTELFAVLNKCRAMVVSEEDCDDELNCLECPYKKQFVVTPVSATKDVLTDEYFSKVPTYIWGKTLFATQEEAEQALKQMGE